MKSPDFPKEVAVCLWSYDINQVDLARDKKQIITNVLNFGSENAVRWLRSTYSESDIIDAISKPLPGSWNKKSLNYWNIVFGLNAQHALRNIR